MENSQSPSDYKDYFNKKFISLFKELVTYLIENLKECDEKSDIAKILSVIDKLNYEKIITKIATNTKLIETITFMNKNNFENEICDKLLNNNEKYWIIMPSFNLNKIFLKLNINKYKEFIYEKINSLHICSVTYCKVIEQLDNCKDGSAFNPFDSVGSVAENIDVESLFNGVEVKNISAYEMLMETIINQQMDNKMTDYMSNIKEDDVNEAASKLHDVLNSEKFQDNKQTSKILSDMLDNIKNEVINLKSDNENMKGKQGVEQLLSIAQKVAGNMMGTIKESNVSVLDIWDATSNLAKNTVQSDALNIVDNLIRSNITANMNKEQEVNVQPNEDTIKKVKKSKKKSDNKNKSNIN
jgi:hypothetical protein